MATEGATSAPLAQLRTLAEFRHRLRLFLQFSENAAQKLGLQPQQHQLLLQIAGAPDGTATTVGYAAERLGLRQAVSGTDSLTPERDRRSEIEGSRPCH